MALQGIGLTQNKAGLGLMEEAVILFLRQRYRLKVGDLVQAGDLVEAVPVDVEVLETVQIPEPGVMVGAVVL